MIEKHYSRFPNHSVFHLFLAANRISLTAQLDVYFIHFGILIERKFPMQRTLLNRIFPSFRWACLIVLVLYVLITASLFSQGLMSSMAKYEVPDAQLNSPHYFNAILWVYSEMLVIGLLVGTMGITVHETVAQLWLSRTICVSHVYFTILDTIASDTPLGNGLYKTPSSIVPAIVGLAVVILFLPLSIKQVDTR